MHSLTVIHDLGLGQVGEKLEWLKVVSFVKIAGYLCEEGMFAPEMRLIDSNQRS